MPKGSKKREAAKRRKSAHKKSMNKSDEDDNVNASVYLGDISNLPSNDRRQGDGLMMADVSFDDEKENNCDESMVGVVQVVGEAKDYAKKQMETELPLEQQSLICVGGGMDGSETRIPMEMEVERPVDDSAIYAEKSVDLGDDSCEVEGHQEKNNEEAILLVVEDGKYPGQAESSEDREIEKDISELAIRSDQVDCDGRDSFEVEIHDETKAEKIVEEVVDEGKEYVEVESQEDMQAEKPSEESMVLVEQVTEDRRNTCEVEFSEETKAKNPAEKLIVPVEKVVDEGTRSYSYEAEVCEKIEVEEPVMKSVISIEQVFDEHSNSCETEACEETKFEKPFKELVTFTEQVTDESRNSWESEICQQVKVVHPSKEIFISTERVINDGRESFQAEVHQEKEAQKQKGKLVLPGDEVLEEVEHGKHEDLQRKVTSLEDCLLENNKNDPEVVLPAEVEFSPSQSINTCNVERKVDTSPVTEVFSRAPLVVQRTTWWNCCGLLDFFMGSEK